MSILSKLGFTKDLDDIYAGIKHLTVSDILGGAETIYAINATGDQIPLTHDDRKVAADGLTSIIADTNMTPIDGESVEEFVIRVSIHNVMREDDELEALRHKAIEVGA